MRRRAPVALIGLLLFAASVRAETATYLGRLAIALDDPRAGGFSGLELDATGTRLWAVSDRGVMLEARLDRAGGGPLRLVAPRIRALRHRDPDRPQASDAEGLALGSRLWISYEGRRRPVAVAPGAPRLPGHPDFRRFAGNAAFEAIAVDERDRLVMLPETTLGRGFPLYRFEEGSWRQIGSLPRRGDFRPVGADFGPDGALYVLERAFLGIGFRSRVRRLRLTDGGIAGEETVLLSSVGAHGNLEGLAVWRDGAGRIRLTMIADDNFRAFQRNEIVEYALSP